MNLKALITTFVLGSSSVASSVAMAHPAAAPAAAPAVNAAPIVRDHRAAAAALDCAPSQLPARPVYQVPRAPAPIYTPAVYQPERHRASWITLGSVGRVADGQMTFRVGRGVEPLSKLKLQSDAGKALIQRVLIQFGNGRTQTVEVNRYLNAANPTITIDLAGRERRVAKVTVIGRNARASAYRVLAI